MTSPTPDDVVAIARLLNRGGMSAAPLERLAAISIYDDDEYENYDFDVVAPRQRWRITTVLEEAAFRQVSGRIFEPPEDGPLAGGPPVVFPKPGILGTDPSWPAGRLLDAGDAIVLVTPTQALLLYLHRFADRPPETLRDELVALVWEQPANLDKAREWARAAGDQRTLHALRDELERAQAEGIELRRQRRFRSRLPR